MAFRSSTYSAFSARDFSVLDLRPYQQTAVSRTFTDGANYGSGTHTYQDTLRVRYAGGELILAGKDFVVDADGHLTGGRLQAIVVDGIDAAGVRARTWSIEQVDMGARDIDAALRSATAADDQAFLNVMLSRGSDTFSLQGGNDVADGKEGDDRLYGGGGDDRLYGGVGNDILSGGVGSDTLVGGAGDDTYVQVGNDDQMTEAVGGGIDLVESTVAWTLAAEFEHLVLTSDGNVNGTGNAGANRIVGGAASNQLFGLAGSDTLDGGRSADTLTGGSGADVFRFSDAPSGNVDTITDFVRGVDRIGLEGEIAVGLPGPLPEAAFRLGNAAVDADDRILYEVSTGLLRYDADGSGQLHVPEAFARVAPGTPLSVADLFISTDLPPPTFRASFYSAGTAQGHDFSTLDFRPIQQTVTSRTLVDGADYLGYAARYEDALTLRFAGGELVFAGKGLTVDAAGHLNGGRLQGIVVNQIDAATGVRTLDWSIEQVDMGAKDADAALRSATTADDQAFLNVMLDRGRDTLELTTGNDTVDGRAGDDYMYGDAGDDLLVGGAGGDHLQGGPGHDTLVGGAGDDRYTIETADDPTDVRIEVAGGGTDWVSSRFSWTLAPEFENLSLFGADAAVNGTGNSAANALYGNRYANHLSGLAGEDTLAGEGGSDTLSGGAGGDEFLFRSSRASVTGEAATLTDFASGVDRIALDNLAFSTIGPEGRLSAAQFRTGTAALDADDRILYDAVTGSIWYDHDGNGGASAAFLFARIAPGSPLVAADFIIV